MLRRVASQRLVLNHVPRTPSAILLSRHYAATPDPLKLQPTAHSENLPSQQNTTTNSEWKDPRSPRFFKSVRLVQAVTIPLVAIYCVFFNDWGDHEHVFSGVRRWAVRQRAAFFELSPAERGMVQSEAPSAGDEQSGRS